MSGHIGSAAFAVTIGMTGVLSAHVLAQAPADEDRDRVVAHESEDLSVLREDALDLVNDTRAEAGMSYLAPSDVLDRVAQGHAADMLKRDFYDHVTLEGETPFERFLAAGGNRWAVSGENIATCEGCPTPPDTDRLQAFHEGWMQSPGHRENILSDGFDSFGFGIVGEGEEVFAVQTFSGPGADTDAAGEVNPLSSEAARELVLEKINTMRTEAGQDPLEGSDALDNVAGQLIENLATDAEVLQKEIFGLLPEGSTGWTSLKIQSASFGGAGTTLTRADLVMIISEWAAAFEGEGSLGNETLSHLGFAGEAAGDGQISAVAVFGERERVPWKPAPVDHRNMH